ncbi:hypothetical protein Btru_042853 [Bulinus truncatus]|nr:hypothetical protein Btru_042853 [Bulinus truncatus]
MYCKIDSNTDMEIIPDLTCPVCLELYTHPVILPCGHVLCRTPCAENILDLAFIRCPVCRDKCYVSGGLSSLPRVISLDSIIDKLKISKQKRSATYNKKKLPNSETQTKSYGACCHANLTGLCMDDSILETGASSHGRIQSYPSGNHSSPLMQMLSVLWPTCSTRQTAVSFAKSFVAGNSTVSNSVTTVMTSPLDLFFNEALLDDIISKLLIEPITDSLTYNEFCIDKQSSCTGSRCRPITKFDLLLPSDKLLPLAVHTGHVANLCDAGHVANPCGANFCDDTLYDSMTNEQYDVPSNDPPFSNERSALAFDWPMTTTDRPITLDVINSDSLLDLREEPGTLITECIEPAINSQVSQDDIEEADPQTGLITDKQCSTQDTTMEKESFQRFDRIKEVSDRIESPNQLVEFLVDNTSATNHSSVSHVVKLHNNMTAPCRPIIDIPQCARNSHTVMLAVAPPTDSDVIDHYEVAYGTKEQKYLQMEELHFARLGSDGHKGPSFILLENLCKRTQYFFNVTAVNQNGRSPDSDLIQCSTLDPIQCPLLEPVILETLSHASCSSATVVCPIKVQSQVTTYRLLYRQDADPGIAYGLAWSGTWLKEGDRHEVVSLSSNTEYQFLVMAVSGHDGHCQLSDKLLLKTVCPLTLN